MRILLVGISTRALAQSAVKAGYEVISLDCFGDRDQPPQAEVHWLACLPGQTPDLVGLAKMAQTFIPRVDRVMVEAGLENEPALLEFCPAEKRWGNTAETVSRSRHLDQLRQALQRTGMNLPECIHPGETLPTGGHYLVKNASLSGGRGVRDWDGISPPKEGEILQRFVEGELASACFIADGHRALLLGLTRQYAGDPALGAPPYAWCGNVAPWGEAVLQDLLQVTASHLTAAFGLVGLNGIDFILGDGIPTLLEVNPRPPASFELFERLLRVNAFQLHVRACQGDLPAKLPPLLEGLCWGKAILFARQPMTMGDTRSWGEQDISDIPHPGEQIQAGAPVCTLCAKGRDATACWLALLARASHWPPV
jgi:predicted ATP-grasp superfamily ATP-dependent carboligase